MIFDCLNAPEKGFCGSLLLVINSANLPWNFSTHGFLDPSAFPDLPLEIKMTFMPFFLRYFRNPCDRDTPTGNFKNFKFFQSSLKILNV